MMNVLVSLRERNREKSEKVESSENVLRTF